MEYYINTGIHSEGPYTIDSLREKHITPDTFVLPQGTDRWMPAGQVEELQSLFVVQSVEPQYQQVVDSYQQTDNQQAGSEEVVQPIQDGSNSPDNNSSANNNNNNIVWWIVGILVALWLYGKINKPNPKSPVQTKCQLCGKIGRCWYYDGGWYCEDNNCITVAKWADE